MLVALPPAVFTAIFPVRAPVGTVAVIEVPEFTMKLVAFTPPKVTWVAPDKPVPVMLTCVPTGPLAGRKLVTPGTTLNFWLLVNVPVGVVTVTNPVVPLAGTVAVM